MRLLRTIPALVLALAAPAGAALPPCDGTLRLETTFPLRGIDSAIGIGAAGDEVWAVSGTLPGNGDYRVGAWHRTAEGWEELPSPVPPEGESYNAFAADVDAGGALWVAGERLTADGERHLVLRWDGTAWEQMDVPRVGVEGYLADIEVVSPADVWAVGAYDSRRFLEQPVVMHFDGVEWTRRRVPTPGCCSSLTDVSFGSATEGWASGTAGRDLLVHFDGETWERVPLDYLGRTRLGVVESAGPGRAWASGSTERGGGPSQGSILRWGGTRWRTATTPDPAGKEGYYAIDSSPYGVWAAGASWSRETRWTPFAIARRDRSWSTIEVERVGGDDQRIVALDATPEGPVWAAGEAWDGRDQVLTVHLACSAPQ